MVTLDYFANEQCKIHFKTVSVRQLSRNIDDETQICAGGKYNVSDTCKGDSGGPLMSENEWFNVIRNVVGVTSFGKSCVIKGMPAVYTRVSRYLPWIEEIIWPGDIKDI